MTLRLRALRRLATLGAACALLAGCEGSARDAAPRVPPVPQPVLAGFGPPAAFARTGTTAVTFPSPLTVSLAAAMATDTFVTVVTTSAAAAIPGGGVTIPAGQVSTVVPVTGRSSGVATVAASLGDASFVTTVQVLDGSEQPRIAALTPQRAALHPGSAQRLTLTLDLPARAGGEVIALSVEPAGAGTVASTASVPADGFEASFVFTAGAAASPARVIASLGASSAVSVLPIGREGLVLNEIDYAQPGSPDAAEFVELLNAGPDPVALGSLAVVLVDGTGLPPTQYRQIALAPAGSLAPGAYLVIGGAAVAASVPAGTAVVALTPELDAIVDAPIYGAGAVVLNSWSGQVIDRLSYVRPLRDVWVDVEGPVVCTGILCFQQFLHLTLNLVEGTELPMTTVDPSDAPGALCRSPDGQDTDDAATDWRACATPTPGAANVP